MYDDIIDLPHHTSARRPRMPQRNRAAQFAPFAALTGFDGVIRDAQRRTTAQITLDESQIAELDRRLRLLDGCLHQAPVVTVTYFQTVPHKSGGVYVTHTGRLFKMDHTQHVLQFEDGTRVLYEMLYSIEGELFD